MTLAVGSFCLFFPPKEEEVQAFLALPEEVQTPMLARAAYAIAGDGYLVQNLAARALLSRLTDPTLTLTSLVTPYLTDPAVCARYDAEVPQEALTAARDAADGFCPFPDVTGFIREDEEMPEGKEVLAEIGGFVFFR